jgi:LPS-assembly lipoprotein
MKRLLIAAFLLPVLAGCGFHLRNALLLPPDLGPVQVVGRDPHSQLVKDLTQAMVRAGAQVAPDGQPLTASGEAPSIARLEIVSERWGSLPLSVDSQGRAQEYTLRYAVIFRLRRADGSDLVPQQVQELSRDYISSPAVASGTEGEREILTAELRRAMAGSILRRIDAVSRMAQEHPEQLPAPSSPDAAPAPDTTSAVPAQDGAVPTP